MKLREVEVGKFRRLSDGERTQPFCIAFVYSKEGNFVVKGMMNEVKTYIEQRHPFSFYRMTFWMNGKSRGLWMSPMALYISYKKIGRRNKFVVSMTTAKGHLSDFLSFRTMPKKWLPIFDDVTARKKR